MKAYKISTSDDYDKSLATPYYVGTFNNVKEKIKELPQLLWATTTVSEVNVVIDKTAIIEALNGHPVITQTAKVWGLTKRGVLKEEK